MDSQLDVKKLRRRMRMTQKQFCRRFGFPLSTLRHWERGDRKPAGTALVLLNVVRLNPRAVAAAVLNTAARERLRPARSACSSSPPPSPRSSPAG